MLDEDVFDEVRSVIRKRLRLVRLWDTVLESSLERVHWMQANIDHVDYQKGG